MLCDANGVPLRFLLSGGQASDIAYAQPLLDEAYIPSLRGRPRKRCRWLLADKGYDAEALRRYCDRYRMQPVIPLRDMKRKPKPGLPRLFDRPKYRQRNIIERMFGWLKENRRIVTRFDKLATSFAAMVSLACAMRCLRQYFSYRAYDHCMRRRAPDPERVRLRSRVNELFGQSRGAAGSRSIVSMMQEDGEQIGRFKVRGPIRQSPLSPATLAIPHQSEHESPR
jgi:transposase